MFTAEIRINGALIATLHVHNKGLYDDEELYPYNYEYFEPRVGVSQGVSNRPQHTTGTVICKKDKGIRHVLQVIFKDLDSKDKDSKKEKGARG